MYTEVMNGSGKNRRDQSGERLHVCTGYTCNNKCIFCMEENPDLHSRRLGIVTRENIEKLLGDFSALSKVMFTSGEPTTNPLLPEFVSMAKMLGYRQIALTTNGRMLSYRSYAAELFERGLNRVVFSIHEAEPKRHDALTRTPGSFLQSMKGLANASAMKKRYGLTIETSTVVTKRNLGRLREIYESLEAYPVDQIVFNIIKPEGRGLTHFKSLVPRYTDVRNGFEALLKEIPAAAHRALLVELPPCLPVNGTGGPAGYIEEFLMFDGEDEPALESKTVVKEAHGGTLFKSARTGQGRVKRKACAGCGSFKICWGVPLRYIEHYGWTEFMPVRGKA